jgi:hypothetical protein
MCDVSGSQCMYFSPNSEACARDYGEGPDAVEPEPVASIVLKKRDLEYFTKSIKVLRHVLMNTKDPYDYSEISKLIKLITKYSKHEKTSPLSLEEVKRRNLKPVWYMPLRNKNSDGWWIIAKLNSSLSDFSDGSAVRESFSNYGKDWVVFDNEP